MAESLRTPVTGIEMTFPVRGAGDDLLSFMFGDDWWVYPTIADALHEQWNEEVRVVLMNSGFSRDQVEMVIPYDS